MPFSSSSSPPPSLRFRPTACSVSEFNFWTYESIWTFGRTPWTGDQPDARPLPTQDNTTQHRKMRTHSHAPSRIRTCDPSKCRCHLICSYDSHLDITGNRKLRSTKVRDSATPWYLYRSSWRIRQVIRTFLRGTNTWICCNHTLAFAYTIRKTGEILQAFIFTVLRISWRDCSVPIEISFGQSICLLISQVYIFVVNYNIFLHPFNINNFCRILTMVCWYWTNCTFNTCWEGCNVS
jgi:hypothetical protein